MTASPEQPNTSVESDLASIPKVDLLYLITITSNRAATMENYTVMARAAAELQRRAIEEANANNGTSTPRLERTTDQRDRNSVVYDMTALSNGFVDGVKRDLSLAEQNQRMQALRAELDQYPSTDEG